MPAEQATQSVNWNNLIKAITNNECVLVLGPNIATLERDGQTVSLHQLLIEHLSEELLKINPDILLLEPSNLPYIAKKLEDALLPISNHQEGRAREKLEDSIKEFYEKYKFSDFPVYAAIAKLPFRFIVNTNPDKFLLDAYSEERKFDAACKFYDYSDPTHNNSIIGNGEDGNLSNKEFITPDAPLIFNMFGSVEMPSSLIITESDRLEFLDTILQRETKAGIPNEIAIEFTSSKEKGIEKTLVFVGFDFNKWHMRLIMHLINRNRYQGKLKETYALQSLKSLPEVTSFFYRRDFEVSFVDSLPEQFAAEFIEKLQNQKESTTEESPKLNAFLVFDEKDQAVKEELDGQLAPLKRNEFIQTWDEEQIIAGSDRGEEIIEKLDKADIILLLVTPNFFGSDDIYEMQLQRALARHNAKEAVVIPILIKSCVWESSVLSDLTTILPRNKIALNEQEDEVAILADTIKQLERWCAKIHKLKNN